ncbi:MAG: hypothetical protein P8X63_03220 [Desulfuromonadaceae bacterium]|jgi:hypothetical protein
MENKTPGPKISNAVIDRIQFLEKEFRGGVFRRRPAILNGVLQTALLGPILISPSLPKLRDCGLSRHLMISSQLDIQRFTIDVAPNGGESDRKTCVSAFISFSTIFA